MEHCSSFPACGGCSYLNLNMNDYLEKKRLFVQSAFLNQGIHVEPEPVLSVPFGRRRRATFAYKNGQIGFNKAKSSQINNLTACPALLPELSDLLPKLQELVLKLKGSGDISVLKTPFGIDMCLKENKPKLTLEKQELLSSFALQNNLVRLSYGTEPVIQQVQLPFSADSFLQPSVEGEQLLINLVLSHIGTPRKAADLFCGAGTFTKPLLNAGFSVKGYDIAVESLSVIKNNAEKRDLFRVPLTAKELNEYDCIVMDPPRAGAEAQCRELAESQVPDILMISCSPKTAARDVSILRFGGYEIKKIIPVDQFIYTTHIELFILLKKEC